MKAIIQFLIGTERCRRKKVARKADQSKTAKVKRRPPQRLQRADHDSCFPKTSSTRAVYETLLIRVDCVMPPSIHDASN